MKDPNKKKLENENTQTFEDPFDELVNRMDKIKTKIDELEELRLKSEQLKPKRHILPIKRECIDFPKELDLPRFESFGYFGLDETHQTKIDDFMNNFKEKNGYRTVQLCKGAELCIPVCSDGRDRVKEEDKKITKDQKE
jgi:hypothetical protein